MVRNEGLGEKTQKRFSAEKRKEEKRCRKCPQQILFSEYIEDVTRKYAEMRYIVSCKSKRGMFVFENSVKS